MPSEVWGYKVGDHVEVREAEGGTFVWRPGKVTRIDTTRNVWVGPTRVRTAKEIRRLQVPATPDEIERWLET